MWWKAVFQLDWAAALSAPNATRWQRVVDAVDADLVARDPVRLVTAARSADECPLPLMPYLAIERSVDEFSTAWPEALQRAVIRGSLAAHKVKGTRGALNRALAPLGYSVRVVEWFESRVARPPYTFRLDVTVGPGVQWLAADQRLLVRAANAAKNAHTLMGGIDVRASTSPAFLFIGGRVRARSKIRVGQVPRPVDHRQSSFVFVGARLRVRERARIAARQ